MRRRWLAQKINCQQHMYQLWLVAWHSSTVEGVLRTPCFAFTSRVCLHRAGLQSLVEDTGY
jgi:hypothetical protein